MQLEEEFKTGEEDETIDFSTITPEGVLMAFTDEKLDKNKSSSTTSSPSKINVIEMPRGIEPDSDDDSGEESDGDFKV